MQSSSDPAKRKSSGSSENEQKLSPEEKRIADFIDDNNKKGRRVLNKFLQDNREAVLKLTPSDFEQFKKIKKKINSEQDIHKLAKIVLGKKKIKLSQEEASLLNAIYLENKIVRNIRIKTAEQRLNLSALQFEGEKSLGGQRKEYKDDKDFSSTQWQELLAIFSKSSNLALLSVINHPNVRKGIYSHFSTIKTSNAKQADNQIFQELLAIYLDAVQQFNNEISAKTSLVLGGMRQGKAYYTPMDFPLFDEYLGKLNSFNSSLRTSYILKMAGYSITKKLSTDTLPPLPLTPLQSLLLTLSTKQTFEEYTKKIDNIYGHNILPRETLKELWAEALFNNIIFDMGLIARTHLSSLFKKSQGLNQDLSFEPGKVLDSIKKISVVKDELMALTSDKCNREHLRELMAQLGLADSAEDINALFVDNQIVGLKEKINKSGSVLIEVLLKFFDSNINELKIKAAAAKTPDEFFEKAKDYLIQKRDEVQNAYASQWIASQNVNDTDVEIKKIIDNFVNEQVKKFKDNLKNIERVSKGVTKDFFGNILKIFDANNDELKSNAAKATSYNKFVEDAMKYLVGEYHKFQNEKDDKSVADSKAIDDAVALVLKDKSVRDDKIINDPIDFQLQLLKDKLVADSKQANEDGSREFFNALNELVDEINVAAKLRTIAETATNATEFLKSAMSYLFEKQRGVQKTGETSWTVSLVEKNYTSRADTIKIKLANIQKANPNSVVLNSLINLAEKNKINLIGKNESLEKTHPTSYHLERFVEEQFEKGIKPGDLADVKNILGMYGIESSDFFLSMLVIENKIIQSLDKLKGSNPALPTQHEQLKTFASLSKADLTNLFVTRSVQDVDVNDAYAYFQFWDAWNWVEGKNKANVIVKNIIEIYGFEPNDAFPSMLVIESKLFKALDKLIPDPERGEDKAEEITDSLSVPTEHEKLKTPYDKLDTLTNMNKDQLTDLFVSRSMQSLDANDAYVYLQFWNAWRWAKDNNKKDFVIKDSNILLNKFRTEERFSHGGEKLRAELKAYFGEDSTHRRLSTVVDKKPDEIKNSDLSISYLGIDEGYALNNIFAGNADFKLFVKDVVEKRGGGQNLANFDNKSKFIDDIDKWSLTINIKNVSKESIKNDFDNLGKIFSEHFSVDISNKDYLLEWYLCHRLAIQAFVASKNIAQLPLQNFPGKGNIIHAILTKNIDDKIRKEVVAKGNKSINLTDLVSKVVKDFIAATKKKNFNLDVVFQASLAQNVPPVTTIFPEMTLAVKASQPPKKLVIMPENISPSSQSELQGATGLSLAPTPNAIVEVDLTLKPEKIFDSSPGFKALVESLLTQRGEGFEQVKNKEDFLKSFTRWYQDLTITTVGKNEIERNTASLIEICKKYLEIDIEKLGNAPDWYVEYVVQKAFDSVKDFPWKDFSTNEDYLKKQILKKINHLFRVEYLINGLHDVDLTNLVLKITNDIKFEQAKVLNQKSQSRIKADEKALAVEREKYYTTISKIEPVPLVVTIPEHGSSATTRPQEKYFKIAKAKINQVFSKFDEDVRHHNSGKLSRFLNDAEAQSDLTEYLLAQLPAQYNLKYFEVDSTRADFTENIVTDSNGYPLLDEYKNYIPAGVETFVKNNANTDPYLDQNGDVSDIIKEYLPEGHEQLRQLIKVFLDIAKNLTFDPITGEISDWIKDLLRTNPSSPNKPSLRLLAADSVFGEEEVAIQILTSVYQAISTPKLSFTDQFKKMFNISLDLSKLNLDKLVKSVQPILTEQFKEFIRCNDSLKLFRELIDNYPSGDIKQEALKVFAAAQLLAKNTLRKDPIRGLRPLTEVVNKVNTALQNKNNELKALEDVQLIVNQYQTVKPVEIKEDKEINRPAALSETPVIQPTISPEIVKTATPTILEYKQGVNNYIEFSPKDLNNILAVAENDINRGLKKNKANDDAEQKTEANEIRTLGRVFDHSFTTDLLNKPMQDFLNTYFTHKALESYSETPLGIKLADEVIIFNDSGKYNPKIAKLFPPMVADELARLSINWFSIAHSMCYELSDGNRPNWILGLVDESQRYSLIKALDAIDARKDLPAQGGRAAEQAMGVSTAIYQAIFQCIQSNFTNMCEEYLAGAGIVDPEVFKPISMVEFFTRLNAHHIKSTISSLENLRNFKNTAIREYSYNKNAYTAARALNDAILDAIHKQPSMNFIKINKLLAEATELVKNPGSDTGNVKTLLNAMRNDLGGRWGQFTNYFAPDSKWALYNALDVFLNEAKKIKPIQVSVDKLKVKSTEQNISDLPVEKTIQANVDDDKEVSQSSISTNSISLSLDKNVLNEQVYSSDSDDDRNEDKKKSNEQKVASSTSQPSALIMDCRNTLKQLKELVEQRYGSTIPEALLNLQSLSNKTILNSSPINLLNLNNLLKETISIIQYPNTNTQYFEKRLSILRDENGGRLGRFINYFASDSKWDLYNAFDNFLTEAKKTKRANLKSKQAGDKSTIHSAYIIENIDPTSLSMSEKENSIIKPSHLIEDIDELLVEAKKFSSTPIEADRTVDTIPNLNNVSSHDILNSFAQSDDKTHEKPNSLIDDLDELFAEAKNLSSSPIDAKDKEKIIPIDNINSSPVTTTDKDLSSPTHTVDDFTTKELNKDNVANTASDRSQSTDSEAEALRQLIELMSSSDDKSVLTNNMPPKDEKMQENAPDSKADAAFETLNTNKTLSESPLNEDSKPTNADEITIVPIISLHSNPFEEEKEEIKHAISFDYSAAEAKHPAFDKSVGNNTTPSSQTARSTTILNHANINDPAAGSPSAAQNNNLNIASHTPSGAAEIESPDLQELKLPQKEGLSSVLNGLLGYVNKYLTTDDTIKRSVQMLNNSRMGGYGLFEHGFKQLEKYSDSDVAAINAAIDNLQAQAHVVSVPSQVQRSKPFKKDEMDTELNNPNLEVKATSSPILKKGECAVNKLSIPNVVHSHYTEHLTAKGDYQIFSHKVIPEKGMESYLIAADKELESLRAAVGSNRTIYIKPQPTNLEMVKARIMICMAKGYRYKNENPEFLNYNFSAAELAQVTTLMNEGKIASKPVFKVPPELGGLKLSEHVTNQNAKSVLRSIETKPTKELSSAEVGILLTELIKQKDEAALVSDANLSQKHRSSNHE